MKKYSISLLLVLFLLVFSLSTAASDITAKSYGMGGAYTGLAEDATAMLYNPAGLSDSGFIGLQLDFGMGASDINKIDELMKDIEYLSEDFDAESQETLTEIFDDFPIVDIDGQFFAGGNFSSFGVGLNIDNKFRTKQINENVIQAINTTNTSGILSISRKAKLGLKDIIGFAYGINVKTLKTDYVDITLDKDNMTNQIVAANGSGLGLDAGMMFNLTERIKVGVNLKNVIAPVYELEGEKEEYTFDEISGDWNDPVVTDYAKEYNPEQSYRLGASVDIPVINTTVVGDFESFTSSQRTVLHLGVEKNILFNGLSLRGGMFSPSDDDPTYTLGLGLNIAAFHFDIAAGSNDGFKDNLNGVLSVNAQF